MGAKDNKVRAEGLDTATGQPVQPIAGEANGRAPALSGDVEAVRFATVLFADIVGSTRLISVLDPEDARDVLDSTITLIRNAIHDFDGMVVRVQGDGVMAVFGVHPAVVCIKWAIQRGQTPIPFSTNRKNYSANLAGAVSPPLTDEDMLAIAGIDKNCRLIKGQVFLWRDGQSWEDLWDLNGEIAQ